jgi:hypothetical protein
MPYLKAMILEGRRKHPPSHFVLPHKAADDMELGGYLIPKGTTVNFMVAKMGQDEQEWERPMEFTPERFLEDDDSAGVDMTGTRGIRMMPFGVGAEDLRRTVHRHASTPILRGQYGEGVRVERGARPRGGVRREERVHRVAEDARKFRCC